MNFDFSEEQIMLRDSVARFVQDDYDFEERQKIAQSETAMSAAKWQTFAELGWLSIPFAEEYGGFAGNATDVMLIMEEFGKGLVVEPYLATVVLFGGVLQKAGTDEQRSSYLPKIIDGSCQGALAYLERQGRYEMADVLTTAVVQGDQAVLNGEKVAVINGANAGHFIVSARTAGEQNDGNGISLFLVPGDAQGVELNSYRMMDGQLVANVVLNNVSVPAANLVGELNNGLAVLEAIAVDAKLAVAAEALGIMGQLNAKTLEYTKTREQFGVAIGSFQVLQHRQVDTFMAYEQTRSLLYRAICETLNGDEGSAATVHALAAMVDRSGKKILGEAIQLHGGMGLTDELDIGHYAKRLMMLNTVFGDGDFHQGKFNTIRYN
jgi:alkylation response protein AidB-like acyl-CoA dehydrogenase